MGKRFSLFLEGNPTPAFFVQNQNNRVMYDFAGGARAKEVNRFAFNFRPQATVEYLVGRDVSIGISYSRIAIGTNRGFLDQYQDPSSTNYSVDYDVVRGQSAGVHLKFYGFDRSASIAPIGFYETFAVYVTQTNTYDDKKSKTKQFKNDFIYPVATVSIGRQTMLARNLLLKTGVEFGWAFVPTNFLTETEDTWTVQEYAGYNVHQSLAGYYLFNFNVALGYALF
ncbi:MAG: hypothetical protein DI538_20865 [Azospira oryzae]|nr:hypothetical protein [Cytophaga sp.]PZR31527.1 MAG: hypothetical protein DI538_20865 [Azospira oryzae]